MERIFSLSAVRLPACLPACLPATSFKLKLVSPPGGNQKVCAQACRRTTEEATGGPTRSIEHIITGKHPGNDESRRRSLDETQVRGSRVKNCLMVSSLAHSLAGPPACLPPTSARPVVSPLAYRLWSSLLLQELRLRCPSSDFLRAVSVAGGVLKTATTHTTRKNAGPTGRPCY